MTIYGTDTTVVRIEQAWARGLVPEEIALRLGVKLAEVLRVGEAMDAAAYRDEQADNWDQGRCRKGLHEMTPDNKVPTNRGGLTCRKCKNEANRISEKKRRARGRAAA